MYKNTVVLTCERCKRIERQDFYSRDQWAIPKGWFKMEDGWRCGCIISFTKTLKG